MSYVSYISNVNYMNYVGYMGYVGRLYKLLVTWVFYESLKITLNHTNCFKNNIFVFKDFKFFLYIRIENSNYKNKNIEKKHSNTRYDLPISYISETIRKIVGGLKDVKS